VSEIAVPEPDPDDAAALLAEAEALLKQAAGETTPDRTGLTRRVRDMTRQVAESHHLDKLQADSTPLLVDDDRTWRKRRKVAQAGKRWQIDQNPDALLYRDQRIRRITSAMTMTAAAIALSISSIGVQDSVAKGMGMEHHSPQWWAAFGVEPAMSLPLLAVVGVQAYSAMRGHVIERTSEAGKRMFKTEMVLLGLTLLLNIWPALPGLRDGVVLPLVVHMLGPIAAVVAVWTLPTIWAVLGALTVPDGTATDLQWDRADDSWVRADDSTGDPYPRGRSLDEHRAELRRLLAVGELAAGPTAEDIRRALGCRRQVAARLRDEIRETN
jgi:hypothetical protein